MWGLYALAAMVLRDVTGDWGVGRLCVPTLKSLAFPHSRYCIVIDADIEIWASMVPPVPHAPYLIRRREIEEGSLRPGTYAIAVKTG